MKFPLLMPADPLPPAKAVCTVTIKSEDLGRKFWLQGARRLRQFKKKWLRRARVLKAASKGVSTPVVSQCIAYARKDSREWRKYRRYAREATKP